MSARIRPRQTGAAAPASLKLALLQRSERRRPRQTGAAAPASLKRALSDRHLLDSAGANRRSCAGLIEAGRFGGPCGRSRRRANRRSCAGLIEANPSVAVGQLQGAGLIEAKKRYESGGYDRSRQTGAAAPASLKRSCNSAFPGNCILGKPAQLRRPH